MLIGTKLKAYRNELFAVGKCISANAKTVVGKTEVTVDNGIKILYRGRNCNCGEG